MTVELTNMETSPFQPVIVQDTFDRFYADIDWSKDQLQTDGPRSDSGMQKSGTGDIVAELQEPAMNFLPNCSFYISDTDPFTNPDTKEGSEPPAKNPPERTDAKDDRDAVIGRRDAERDLIIKAAKDLADKWGELNPLEVYFVLKNTIESTFKKHGADPSQFMHFGITLSKEMQHRGIGVRHDRNAISFHSEGANLGVEFSLDPKTGTAKVQAFDWQTKEDVPLNANWTERLVNNLGYFTPSELVYRKTNGTLRDGKELAGSLFEAATSRDYSKFDLDLSRSVKHAYENGDMKAVERLMQSINNVPRNSWDTRRPLLFAVKDATSDQVRIHEGKELSRDARELANDMTPEELARRKLIKLDDYIYKLTDEGKTISVAKKR